MPFLPPNQQRQSTEGTEIKTRDDNGMEINGIAVLTKMSAASSEN